MKRKVRKELEPWVERCVDCTVWTAAERSGNRVGISSRGDIGHPGNGSGNGSGNGNFSEEALDRELPYGTAPDMWERRAVFAMRERLVSTLELVRAGGDSTLMQQFLLR